MLIIIIDNNKLVKKEISNEYKYKGIYFNITKNIIKLEDNFYFEDNTCIKNFSDSSFLIYYGKNVIKLYIYEDSNGIDDYHLYHSNNIYFSCKKDSNVIINDDNLSGYYLELINNHLDSNYDDVFINHQRIHDYDLKQGDLVEVLGISFYYFKDFIYLNNFLIDIKLQIYEIKEETKLKINNNIELLNYYEAPKKGLELKKLKEFNPPRKTSSRRLILQVGPTITMSLAMILMASVSIYNTYANNGSYLNIISLLIMPVTMLVSGILWPVLSSSSDSRNYKKEYNKVKNEYIEYLKKYEQDVDNKIRDYVNEEKRYLFDGNIDNRLFYINHDSSEFLNITIGYQTKNLEFSAELTEDKDIDEHLKRILYRINHIENCPLYLSVKNNSRITVLTNYLDREYLLKKYLLELLVKYHYDDIKIAVYSKDKNIFKDILYLPHIFIDNKRLTLTEKRELHELNSLYLDKPLILLLNDYTNYEFTNPNIYTIYFSDNKTSILKNSSCIVEYNINSKGILNEKNRILFTYYYDQIDFNNCFSILSKFINSNPNSTYSFRHFNNLDIVEHNYSKEFNGLKAEFATINDEIMSFDLHESKDGPHGLIGGSTGSGKSELIISLLLSLTIKYTPKYLNIILIDYKGGGIKDSLSYGKIPIPHIIADVNNLESDTFERLIVSIARECKRREALFKELSLKASSSIMNIDEYLAINKEYELIDIAHLLIVVDEFAELKKENPYIIKELISFSRIGRSLGIHLILATQKPSGVIDEEIWSNSHFKIALKVHNEKDSEDIIKLKDAAYLLSPGEFYLQVDLNTIKAKSLYAKKDIRNNDEYNVELLDNRLNTIKKKIHKQKNIVYESTYFSKQIIDISNKYNLIPNKLEFEKPKPLSRIELMNKYQVFSSYVFGEKDDYLNAKKGILSYSIDDNLIIYSNRNDEINIIINTLNENSRNSIVISNNIYKGGYILDSIEYGDDEDIEYLFNKLTDDIRSKLTLVIEDISTLLSYDEDYVNKIYKLIRRSSISEYSIILLTKQSNINFKLLNSIKNKLAINIFDNQDLINIYSTKGQYKGKSYYFDNMPITFIPCAKEEFVNYGSLGYSYIEKVPYKVNYEYSFNNLLIGYSFKTRNKILIKENETVLITSFDNEILRRYKILFIRNSNIKIKEYSDDLFKDNYTNIIWLKNDIKKQRLFYIEKDIDLKDNEAYFYRNNKGSIIRFVSYE